MASYRIWYALNSRDLGMGLDWCSKQGTLPVLPCEDEDRTDTHMQLMSINAESLADVFRRMQGEVWSPNGEGRKLIEQLGLSHTSMSVGDMIEDVATRTFYFVDRVGFAEIEHPEDDESSYDYFNRYIAGDR